MAASSNSDPKSSRDEDDESAGTDPTVEETTDAAHEAGPQDPLVLKPKDEDAEPDVEADRTDDADGTEEPVSEESEDSETTGAVEEAELVSDEDAENLDAPEEMAADGPSEREPEAEPAPEPAPRPEPVRSEPQQGGSGGFLPLLLGGVAAAGIGFAVAQYAVPEGWPTPATPDPAVNDALTSQAERIATLEATIAALQDTEPMPAPEIDEAAIASAVEAQLGDTLRGERTAALDALTERLDELTAEVATLAERPVATESAALSDDQIAALQANLDAAVADARAEMEAALEAAAAAEAAADRAAQTAAARAALERVRAAAESGTPYADVLEPIRTIGTDVPEALAGPAEAGLPALSALQESFPDAARAALDASIRSAGSEDPMDRAMAFLRTQTGARSLTPREGDDPDAVLSRAEAALRAGDLAGVLTELDALPEAGQAEMSAWRAQAEARVAALAALSELSQALDET